MYFLADFWSIAQWAYLFNSKILYVNCDDDHATCQEVPVLYSSHEEADCQMLFDLKSVDPLLNVVVRPAGIDCVAIAQACSLNYDKQ